MKQKNVLVVAMLLLVTMVVFANGTQESTAKANEEVDMSVVYKQPGGEFVLTPQMIGYKDAEIELTWQPNPSQSLVSTIPARVENLSAKLETWVKAHPNVKVIPVGTTSNINNSMTKLRLSVVEGNAPDICAVDSFMMPLFLDYGRDVSDIAEEKGIDINDYFPFVKKQVMVGDELRALWNDTDVRALFYRKDLIETPPTTVDEVIKVGKEMAKQGKIGLIYLGGRGEGTVNNLWGMFWSQGGKLVDSDGNMVLDKEPNKTALINVFKFIKRTIDEGVTPKTIINYGRDSNLYGDAAAGNVAMFMANTGAINEMRSIMGTEKFFQLWGMAPLPVIEKGQTSSSSAGGWTNMVFSKDELHRRLAADLVIDLFNSDSAAESWLKVEGALPTQQHQFKVFKFISKDPYISRVAEYLNSAKTRPAVAIYNTISTEVQVAIGDVITGGATPEQAVESVIKNVNNK